MTDSTPSGAIALLFSGGLDTTLEVVERLKEFEHVHLLTFNNGCCINMRGADDRVAELRQRLSTSPPSPQLSAFSPQPSPQRLHHEVINTRPLLQELLHDHPDLLDGYRSPLVFDLACKMSACVGLVNYALRHKVTVISDGSAKEQTQIFLQHPEFTSHIKPFFTECGICFVPPVHFDKGREEKIRLLQEQGFKSGVSAFEKLHITSQLKYQPFCLRGFVTFFFTSPLRHLGLVRRRALSIADARALWDRLLPIARQHIETPVAES